VTAYCPAAPASQAISLIWQALVLHLNTLQGKS